MGTQEESLKSPPPQIAFLNQLGQEESLKGGMPFQGCVYNGERVTSKYPVDDIW